MRIIEGTMDFKINEKTAVAIGKFDGIHRGHRRLLEVLLSQKNKGYHTCVFTFDPPPSTFFAKEKIGELTTKEEKRRMFAKMGIDTLLEFPLTKESAAMAPEFFVKEILVEKMNAGFIVAGTDLSFGDKGKGNSELLIEMSKELGYQVWLIDKVCWGEREVSSSYIREEVTKGNMELVEQLLGNPYSVYGQVKHGNKIGRTIGMPTVNQVPPEEKLLPPNGVYYSEIELQGRVYKGITNIGYKPTVSDKPIMGVETFIYNFNQDVYGDMVEVRLFSFRRPEMKFDGVEQLKAQMKQDIEAGALYSHKQ